ncbi:MAG TPA: hypothetical protein ENK66_01015 [Arcobacter sp.]|jgi:hypothetical protein|nr:hypothetical protein [Arcobacter sp.]
MFSFLKRLQEFIERIKRNKGLWFTTLTLSSIIGIFLFMYILLNMTNSVKDQVYLSIHEDYHKSLDNILSNKKSQYYSIIQALQTNEELLSALEKNNKQFLINYTQNINEQYKRESLNSIIVSIYPFADKEATVRNTISSTLRSKGQIFGLEVQQSGVYITLIQPIERNGFFYGLVEIKQSIHSIKDEFEASDNNFVFLLDKKMLSKLSLKAKSGRYKDVVTDFIVYQSAYSSRFYTKITDNGEESFKEDVKQTYGADEVYFRTYKKATDINGADIGMFVIGEGVEKNNGFVNIADSMVNSVTSVSLGLVISIILFMF